MRRSDANPGARGALRRAALGLVVLLAATGARAAASDGHALYAPCAACHGVHAEGSTSTGAPPLAGLDAAYVARQLNGFASGWRGTAAGDSMGAAMRAMAVAIRDDAARTALGRYVAGLPLRSGARGVQGNDNGRNYWNAICSACHGANGKGDEALGAPRLTGMPVAYLQRQFAAFRSGTRGAAAGDRLGAQMRAVAAMLPDARTADDVIGYVAGLAP